MSHLGREPRYRRLKLPRLNVPCAGNRMRNFPNDPKEGERLLRESYHTQMERLGVVVEDGGLVVDMGCGTGSSARYARVLNYGRLTRPDHGPSELVGRR